MRGLEDILIRILSFNILMNKNGLYHGDIKPHNMVFYEDEDEIEA